MIRAAAAAAVVATALVAPFPAEPLPFLVIRPVDRRAFASGSDVASLATLYANLEELLNIDGDFIKGLVFEKTLEAHWGCWRSGSSADGRAINELRGDIFIF